MKSLFIILFLTMAIYAVFFRLILIMAYSNEDDFKVFENRLRSHPWSVIRKTIHAMDFFGGHRFVVGFLGLAGVLVVLIF